MKATSSPALVTLPLTDGTGMAQVDRTEEKGSDVNLASYLLFDAFDQDFETALVISNDSDLVFPVGEVRQRFGVTVGVACPVYHSGRHPSRELVKATDFNVHITRKRRKLLRTSQLPDPGDRRGGPRDPQACRMVKTSNGAAMPPRTSVSRGLAR